MRELKDYRASRPRAPNYADTEFPHHRRRARAKKLRMALCEFRNRSWRIGMEKQQIVPNHRDGTKSMELPGRANDPAEHAPFRQNHDAAIRSDVPGPVRNKPKKTSVRAVI